MDAITEEKRDPRSQLIKHISAFGGTSIAVQDWVVPNGWAPDGVSIIVVEPSEQYPWWSFATAGCWQAVKNDHHRSEFILTANDGRSEHVEHLKMAAFLHVNPKFSISLGKVLDVGQAWLEGSACTHLLASLPYPFGPYFEYPDLRPCTRFIWLLPITAPEAALARTEGVETLEELFDEAEIVFADPLRASVVD